MFANVYGVSLACHCCVVFLAWPAGCSRREQGAEALHLSASTHYAPRCGRSTCVLRGGEVVRPLCVPCSGSGLGSSWAAVPSRVRPLGGPAVVARTTMPTRKRVSHRLCHAYSTSAHPRALLQLFVLVPRAVRVADCVLLTAQARPHDDELLAEAEVKTRLVSSHERLARVLCRVRYAQWSRPTTARAVDPGLWDEPLRQVSRPVEPVARLACDSWSPGICGRF